MRLAHCPPPSRAPINRLALLAVAAAALAVGGCGQSSRFNQSPSWSLTGGKGAAPPPPAAAETAPVYRGGRDPVTGRAGAYGAMDRVESVPLAPPPSSPAGPPAPFSGQQAALAPRPVPGAYPAPAAGPVQPNTFGRRVVEVQPGDSLASLAAANRISIASLMFANGLRDAYVTPGQKLVLPPR